MLKIQAIRGMNDILPDDISLWHFVEHKIKSVLDSYGFQEIRLPIVEKSELFHRSVGDSSDIIEKETYDFVDRNQENITLRPEGTAGCVRAMIEHGLLYNQQQKVWYSGPMFRYERPQKGRYRQFYQFGAEIYGASHISADAELISMTWALWLELGISKNIVLEINNLGSADSRKKYVKDLVSYLTPLKDFLDADSIRRLEKNPLRILDTKNVETQKILQNAPRLQDYLDDKDCLEFNELCSYISNLNIPFKINTNLVRGLDYYSGIVYEWTTDCLGAQGSVCAGGRYDKLVEQLDGGAIPATGFGMGMERIVLLLQSIKADIASKSHPDIFIVSDEKSILKAMQLVEPLRRELPNLKIIQNFQLSGIKAQFKKANKLDAKFVVVIAENEITNKELIIKNMREDGNQDIVAFENLISYFKKIYQNK